MPRKTAVKTGRPPAMPLTPEQFELMAEMAEDTYKHLRDVAKHMRETKLPQMIAQAQTVMKQHLPTAQAFARQAWSEVGPAAIQYALGQPSRIAQNQEKHKKAMAKKKASS